MREVKFRGLSINGYWSYGLLAHTEHKDVACGDTGYFISNKAGCAFAYQVRPETVGQYTGLKDKNGKEIYEGDICRDTNGKIGKIVYESCSWNVRFGQGLDYYPLENYFSEPFSGRIEIIGNIYENVAQIPALS